MNILFNRIAHDVLLCVHVDILIVEYRLRNVICRFELIVSLTEGRLGDLDVGVLLVVVYCQDALVVCPLVPFLNIYIFLNQYFLGNVLFEVEGNLPA